MRAVNDVHVKAEPVEGKDVLSIAVPGAVPEPTTTEPVRAESGKGCAMKGC